MSKPKPVITIQLGNRPVGIYRLPDGRLGMANEIACVPFLLSFEQCVLQWLEMAQVGNQHCIELIKECLQYALDYSREHWRDLMTQDILERALANDESAIRELKYYLLSFIEEEINEYNWLKSLEDLQEVMREKDEKITEIES